MAADKNNILTDSFGRTIDYLRVSVTDRCNMRCYYCMPAEGIKLYDRPEILSLEEIVDAVNIFTECGVKKIRVTGGEPLLRKNIIYLLKKLKNIPEIESVSLTTNGLLLGKYLKDLKDTGMERLNISIDCLDDKKFKEITAGADLKTVLENLHRAINEGFKEIKINTVLTDCLDTGDIEDFIKLAVDYPVSVRFIERMEIDNLNLVYSSLKTCKPVSGKQKKNKPVSVVEIKKIMRNFGRYYSVSEKKGFGPATYFKSDLWKGYVGFIIDDKNVCSFCNRVRLTSTGKVRLCLFSDVEFNLRDRLRQGLNQEIIVEELKNFIKGKPLNRELLSGNGLEKTCKKLSDSMNKIGG
jgi:cyclic pyranopterin phosphate synthase